MKTVYLQDVAWAERTIGALLAKKPYIMLVAELDDKDNVFHQLLYSAREKWNEAIITPLFVHKDHQGKGIASRLLGEAIGQTDKIGMMELQVASRKDNESAIRLYRKHGFFKGYLPSERVRKVRPREV